MGAWGYKWHESDAALDERDALLRDLQEQVTTAWQDLNNYLATQGATNDVGLWAEEATRKVDSLRTKAMIFMKVSQALEGHPYAQDLQLLGGIPHRLPGVVLQESPWDDPKAWLHEVIEEFTQVARWAGGLE